MGRVSYTLPMFYSEIDPTGGTLLRRYQMVEQKADRR